MPNPQFTVCQGGRAGRRREPVFHRDPAEDRRHGRGDGEGRRHMKKERMVRDSCLKKVNDWYWSDRISASGKRDENEV